MFGLEGTSLIQPPGQATKRSLSMLDVLFLVITLGFFIGSVAYTHFCERA